MVENIFFALGPFYGKEGPENAQDLTRSTRYCTFIFRLGRSGELPHFTFITYVLDTLYNGTPHCFHVMIQFRYIIFNHVHLFSAVHLHDYSRHFCIIICDSPLPFIFTPQDGILENFIKG